MECVGGEETHHPTVKAVTPHSIRTMDIHNAGYMQDGRGQANVSGIIYRGSEGNLLSSGEEGQKCVVQIGAGSDLPKSAHCVISGSHHYGGVSIRIKNPCYVAKTLREG